jgi:uncharacterized membrane protein YidH (DUF202 family)
MIMLCWFYCIPFAKFLYFAISPIVFVFSLFMLKRAARADRPFLKQLSFMLMGIAFSKICLFDIRELKKNTICGFDEKFCTREVMQTVDTLSLVLLVVGLGLIIYYYRIYMRRDKVAPMTPEEAGVPFWANLAMTMIIVMVIWQMAPWVGYLTIGSIPKIFTALPWQVLAILNFFLLLIGFWKSENCVWNYDVSQKKKMGHLNKTWTVKDTLWTGVFVYLITLALSYVAHDVLTLGMTTPPPT